MRSGGERDEERTTGDVANGDIHERLKVLHEEGREIADRFHERVRDREWHPFVAADYERVEQTLSSLRQPGLRFLEWGSATGIITIMADMLGYEAFGIELDEELVGIARDMADRFGSRARFAAGSYLPAGYRWQSDTGDRRLGTIGQGRSGYLELQHPLEDFDLVFGYPWGGEEPVMLDLMRCYGGKNARLLLHCTDAIRIYERGRRVD
jgi:hypothetical protein